LLVKWHPACKPCPENPAPVHGKCRNQVEKTEDDDICLWHATGECARVSLYTNKNKDCDGHRKCFAYVSKKKHDEAFKQYNLKKEGNDYQI
jgi:hypothetical protein